METSIRIVGEAFDPEGEIARFRRRCDGAGAIASFVGQVRGESGAALRLALEHYPGYTERAVAAHCAQAGRRWALEALAVVHRVGEMAPGEAIVLVAAAARHRRDAFSAVDFLMDHLKADAPFWKRELHAAGWRWIEPRAEDRDDIARWRKGER